MLDYISRHVWFAAALTASLQGLAAQQSSTVVPALAQSAYGGSLAMLPGADVDGRLQVIVDEPHLGLTRVGQQITTLRFRRERKRLRSVAGGDVTMLVRMGPAAHPATEARPFFTSNFDAAAGLPTTVFQGVVSFPSTTLAAPAQPDWTPASDTIVIQLSQPYRYTGGSLCIELEGTATASGPGTWIIDAVAENLHGIANEIGPGCGDSGKLTVSTSCLVAGSTADFIGRGPIGQNAVLMFGEPLTPLDLGGLGLADAGCTLHVQPYVACPAAYGQGATAQSTTATASVTLRIPHLPSVLSGEITAQFASMTSPLQVGAAVTCRVADQIPTLGMSMVRARAVNGVMPVRGMISTNRAPAFVIEFAP